MGGLSLEVAPPGQLRSNGCEMAGFFLLLNSKGKKCESQLGIESHLIQKEPSYTQEHIWLGSVGPVTALSSVSCFLT